MMHPHYWRMKAKVARVRGRRLVGPFPTLALTVQKKTFGGGIKGEKKKKKPYSFIIRS